MADIFEEVDEDLRRDQALKLWRKYGAYVFAVAIAIVIATGGYVAWEKYRTKQLMADGDAFVRAALLRSAGQTGQAAQAFKKLAENAYGGYGSLARLNEAALLVEQGEAGEAVKIYDQIAKSAPDQALRDLAVICSVSLSVDSVDPNVLKTKLDPVAAPESPFRHSARELLAVLAMKQGDTATAIQLFKELAADKTAPSGIRTRAEEMLQALS